MNERITVSFDKNTDEATVLIVRSKANIHALHGQEAKDALTKLEKFDRLADALREHHEWQKTIGVVKFPAEPEDSMPEVEIDLSLEYSETDLCSDTMRLLGEIPSSQPVITVVPFIEDIRNIYERSALAARVDLPAEKINAMAETLLDIHSYLTDWYADKTNATSGEILYKITKAFKHK